MDKGKTEGSRLGLAASFLSSARCLSVAAATVGVLVLTAVAPAAAQPIGTADAVGTDTYRRADGIATAPVELYQRVWRDDAVITDFDGQIGILLDDGSRLAIGPRSIVDLDQFIWYPETGVGALHIEMQRGVARLTSGAIPDRGYRILTPTSRLGIRGTDLLMFVNQAGETMIAVLDGVASIHAIDGPETAIFGPQTVGVVTDVGEVVQVSVGIAEEMFASVLNLAPDGTLPEDADLDAMMNRVMTDIY